MTYYLSYSEPWDRWVFRDTEIDKMYQESDASFEMLICNWGGEYSYKFLVWHAGEWFECVTPKQMRERLECIEENEGSEMADLWNSYQLEYEVVREHHPVFKLQKRWEAMMALDLFAIGTTLKAWAGKPMCEEGISKMNALREKQMLETVRAMDEAMAAADEGKLGPRPESIE